MPLATQLNTSLIIGKRTRTDYEGHTGAHGAVKRSCNWSNEGIVHDTGARQKRRAVSEPGTPRKRAKQNLQVDEVQNIGGVPYKFGDGVRTVQVLMEHSTWPVTNSWTPQDRTPTCCNAIVPYRNIRELVMVATNTMTDSDARGRSSPPGRSHRGQRCPERSDSDTDIEMD